MKKIISFALAVVMIAGLFSVIPMTVTAEESSTGVTEVGAVPTGYVPVGTAIEDEAGFANMTADGKYYLAKDIEITESYASKFTGTLDGNGHTVTVSVPLFKEFSGEAKNLVITGTIQNENEATAVAGTTKSKEETDNPESGVKLIDAVIGSVAVFGDGTFTNILNKANLTGKCTIGGLVGLAAADVSFTDCINTGKILYQGKTALQWNALGGILGTAVGNTSFVNCSNNGVVDCDGKKASAGGIAGTGNNNKNETATMKLKSCINNAEIKGGWQTGGIVGWAAYTNLIMEYCKNTANVSSCFSYAAGIVARSGENNTVAIGCVNEGEITSSLSHSGGIISLVEQAGANENTIISNCYNKGKICPSIVSKNAYVGGIVGYLKGVSTTVTNCTNDGEIYVDVTSKGGSAYVSGIVGTVGEGTGIKYITNCVNNAPIYAKGGSASNTRVGGMVGNLNMQEPNIAIRTIITGCLNAGTIEGRKAEGGTKNPSAGGIVGWAEYSATINNCINTAEVKSDYAAGGIIGKGYRGEYYVEYCINTADITGNSQVAGIAGAFDPAKSAPNYYQSHISYCGNYGNINGNTHVGGILGYQYGTKVAYPIIDGCYTIGNITAKSGHASGIVAYLNTVNVEVRNCFGSGKVTGSTSSNAILFNNKEVSTKIENNYFTEGYATNLIAQGLNAATPKEATPFASNLTDGELKSGELAFKLNEAIQKRVFYQNIGTDAAPTVDKTHAPVNLYGGRYFNINEGGASVRAFADQENATVGVRFRSLISKDAFDAIQKDVAEIGVIIAPKVLADAAGEMTFEALEAYKASSGKANVYISVKRSGTYATSFSAEELTNGCYEIKGSLVNIKDASMEFAAVGYIKLKNGTVFYGSTDVNSAKAIATAAVADVKAAAETGYEYEVEAGVFSPYTKKAYESLKALAK